MKMGHYLLQGSYSANAWAAQIANPQNRLEQVSNMLAPSGINIVQGFAAFGENDLVLLIEAPDDKTMAAASITIGSTGSVTNLKTTPLMPIEDLVDALKIAQGVAYTPPTG